jgi:hypothetical protein
MKRSFTQRAVLAGAVCGLVAVLAGCASLAPRERLYTGWVRFTGEFVLYSNASAFADSRTSHCLSGALSPAKQKDAAARFNGKRVIVRARPVRWALPDPQALMMNNQGTPITNWCGRDEVLFATEMKLYDVQ